MKLDLTSHWAGYLSLIIFIAAYVFVVFEELTRMRKSKPVMLAAGLIWVLIGVAYAQEGRGAEAHDLAVRVIEECTGDTQGVHLWTTETGPHNTQFYRLIIFD